MTTLLKTNWPGGSLAGIPHPALGAGAARPSTGAESKPPPASVIDVVPAAPLPAPPPPAPPSTPPLASPPDPAVPPPLPEVEPPAPAPPAPAAALAPALPPAPELALRRGALLLQAATKASAPVATATASGPTFTFM